MDPATREALVEQFRTYLDSAEDATPEPPADTPDLFSLLAELAALKNEVKIESRQVKSALDEFRGVFETVQQANSRLDEELNRQREGAARAGLDAERGLLLELLELRDRMQAGHDQLLRYHPGWLARRGGSAEYITSIAEGQGMLLRRLDETLAQRGVRPLPAIGRRFDPTTMHAADTAHDSEQDDGLVLNETRTGYLHHNRLLRPAEVIVNKKEARA